MKPKPDNTPRSKLLGYTTRQSPGTDGSLAERLKALVERCDKEAGSLNVAELTSHAAFQEIVSMGDDVVPLLLGGLVGDEPKGWFGALQRITGVNPVSTASRGNPKSMAQDWLRWGRERGIMPAPRSEMLSGNIAIASEGGDIVLQAAHARLTPEEAELMAARLVDAARRARHQAGKSSPE